MYVRVSVSESGVCECVCAHYVQIKGKFQK